MKVIEISSFGAPDVLRLSTRPDPVANTDDEVVIDVKAIGLNRADLLQRRGLYPPPKGASDLLGLEISGIRQDTKERVCVLLSGGGYAEKVIAPKSLCLPLPDWMSFVEGAILPEALFTCVKNLIILGRMTKNEHILIHGGSSGIGTMAIQLAKFWGARVSTSFGQEIHREKLLSLGVDRAIHYPTENFIESLKDDPVDVVLDMVGGTYLNKNMSVMRPQGRMISIAYLENEQATISIAQIMRKNITLTGSTLRHDTNQDKEKLADFIRTHIWPTIENRAIKPVLYSQFAFEDAVLAHQTFEKGGHFGKFALQLT
jgi:NADPH:quinone reductase